MYPTEQENEKRIKSLPTQIQIMGKTVKLENIYMICINHIGTFCGKKGNFYLQQLQVKDFTM